MSHHYLLSASGPDHPGIVARVTELLYQYKCNLEDSSMMRLGAEFGIFLIFSCHVKLSKDFDNALKNIGRKIQLQISYKSISEKLAQSSLQNKNPYRVTLHGADKPGIVFKLTELLAESRFNITDLQTHRTKKGKQAGYILFVEGNFPTTQHAKLLNKRLDTLRKALQVTIHLDSLESLSL